jgi:uncharacterized protein YlxP (DUF503 family)
MVVTTDTALAPGGGPAAVAEVGHQDLWQRARLSAALTSGSLAELERAADRVERHVVDRYPDGAAVSRYVTSVEDIG